MTTTTMPTILTLANQKGGVGKTTTAVNLAVALTRLFAKRVLLIDMDAQGNATTSLGLVKNELTVTIADVLLGETSLNDAIVCDEALEVAVIGANRELTGLDMHLASRDNPQLALKNALVAADLSAYEFIIIDAPPSLSLVTVNALMATDGVIIPMQCEYYALEGVADLLYTIQQLNALNPKLKVEGVVRTLFDSRNVLAQDVTKELENHFGALLYDTVIPRNVRLAEAPSFGGSIFRHDNSSKGAQAYQKLAKEVLLRLQKN